MRRSLNWDFARKTQKRHLPSRFFAYRIGQGKTVIVHKFVSKGTIEEKINRMLEDKSRMAEQVIGASSGENWITELSNEALLDLMRLE